MFWTKIVAVYPENLVRDLIAHELVHVCQNAWGWDFTDTFLIEEEADRALECWGFSADAIDDWDRQHGISRVIEWDKLSKAARRRIWKQKERAGRF